MKELYNTVILLIKSALTGEKVEIPENTDWLNILKLSKKHQITSVIYYGILNSKPQITPEIQEKFFNVAIQSIMQEQNQFAALNKISAEFEHNKIDYLPLKGTVIKKLYPKSEMRMMSDMDILIRPEKLESVCTILEKNGFVKGDVTENVVVYNLPPFVSFEIHTALVTSEDTDYFDYFKNHWNKAVPVKENSYRYKFANEDLFIFVFVHLVKHYREGGIGVRQFLDIWVMLNKFENLNQEYILKELDKLSLCEFYNNVVSTVKAWFGEADSNEITDFITERTFESGSYGTAEKYYAARAARIIETKGKEKNSTVLRILGTVFLPLSAMKDVFPVLNKAPFLLPVMWVVRGFKTILLKPKNMSKQVNRIKNSTNTVAKEYSDELQYVGLKFK